MKIYVKSGVSDIVTVESLNRDVLPDIVDIINSDLLQPIFQDWYSDSNNSRLLDSTDKEVVLYTEQSRHLIHDDELLYTLSNDVSRRAWFEYSKSHDCLMFRLEKDPLVWAADFSTSGFGFAKGFENRLDRQGKLKLRQLVNSVETILQDFGLNVSYRKSSNSGSFYLFYLS